MTAATPATPVAPLVVQRRPLAELHLDPANTRLHDERNLDAIAASLNEFGQVEPLVVRKGKGTVIGGNGRLEAMKKLGWTECDVVEFEGSDVQAAALGIALNRTGDLSEFDKESLGKMLKAIEEDPSFVPGVAALAFDQDELEALYQSAKVGQYAPDQAGGGAVVEPETPMAPLIAVTQPGDLWLLGEHRLLCGNSAEAADVDRLLDGQPIHLVNMDPPYNVKVEPRSNNAIAAGLSSFAGTTHHQKLDVARHPEKAKKTHDKLRAKDRPLANDFISEEAFDDILRAWFGNASRVLLPGRGFYIWGGYANCANYPSALLESGLYFSQAVIWVKEHPVLTRKDFMGNHEWCFYGWKEGAAHEWFGPTNATDVWSVKKVNPQSMVHLTEKPVELAVRAIMYSSREGENVLDLFGGSGSTIMGCEQTKRRGYSMELDMPYCDVIVQRWQKMTGKEAVLHSAGPGGTDGSLAGHSFVDVARERGVDLDGAKQETAAPAQPAESLVAQ